MSASANRKKHVRFANMEDEEEQEEQEEEEEEDTLFDKSKDGGGRAALRSALRAARRSGEPRSDTRAEETGRRGGTCGRWSVTLALCASFLGLGMSISVLGPTFEDLALNVKKNISNISYIFVGRSAGYIGGSLLGGFLFDCMNPHILLGLSLLVTALGMCSIPFCQQALVLTGLMSSIGVSMGVLDTGGNVLLLSTWAEQAGPHLQALHFSFASGAFVSPIIAKLLFAPGGGSAPNATVPGGRGGALQSMWAYVVIGSFVLLVSAVFFALSLGGGGSRERGRGSGGGALRPRARHHAALVALLFFFFFAYVGAEVAYGSFVFTFAKDYARMEASQAAGLNSLFWAAFAACRGLAVFFAACMSPGAMILLSLAGATASSLLLVLFSREKAVLWVCTGLYGASMASTFPGGISWLEQYTAVTGRTAAAFVVGAGLGEMVLPALLGFLLGFFRDQPLLMYLALATSAFASILFPVMYKLASAPPAGRGGKRRRRGRADADDGEYRRALLDAGAAEEDEEENEADRWNDADFEVVEMDDAAPPGSAPFRPGDADSPRRKLPPTPEREKRD